MNHTKTAPEARILSAEGIASEKSARCMEYISQTMLFKKIIAYVAMDTPSAVGCAVIMNTCGYNANPDTMPTITASLSIQWL